MFGEASSRNAPEKGARSFAEGLDKTSSVILLSWRCIETSTYYRLDVLGSRSKVELHRYWIQFLTC